MVLPGLRSRVGGAARRQPANQGETMNDLVGTCVTVLSQAVINTNIIRPDALVDTFLALYTDVVKLPQRSFDSGTESAEFRTMVLGVVQNDRSFCIPPQGFLSCPRNSLPFTGIRWGVFRISGMARCRLQRSSKATKFGNRPFIKSGSDKSV